MSPAKAVHREVLVATHPPAHRAAEPIELVVRLGVYSRFTLLDPQGSPTLPRHARDELLLPLPVRQAHVSVTIASQAYFHTLPPSRVKKEKGSAAVPIRAELSCKATRRMMNADGWEPVQADGDLGRWGTIRTSDQHPGTSFACDTHLYRGSAILSVDGEEDRLVRLNAAPEHRPPLSIEQHEGRFTVAVAPPAASNRPIRTEELEPFGSDHTSLTHVHRRACDLARRSFAQRSSALCFRSPSTVRDTCAFGDAAAAALRYSSSRWINNSSWRI
jgi:hypothetical protein